MTHWNCILFLTLVSFGCDYSDDLPNDDCQSGNSPVYLVTEQPPVFASCDSISARSCHLDAIHRYLFENIVYPIQAKNVEAEGSVVISFIVEKSGCLSNIVIVKSMDYGCDDEAVRVVRMMPRWLPGTVNGNPERVSYFLKIDFLLD